MYFTVLSLKCYICNNLNDGKGCGHGNDADSALIKDCTEQAHEDGQHNIEYKICRKIVTWIDFDVNNSMNLNIMKILYAKRNFKP